MVDYDFNESLINRDSTNDSRETTIAISMRKERKFVWRAHVENKNKQEKIFF
jgi:hypothetical protein